MPLWKSELLFLKAVDKMSFAIIKTGGKQYKVKEGDRLKVEKLPYNEGEEFDFDDVLLWANSEDLKIGKPLVDGAKVKAKVLKTAKAKKVIVFRYTRKTRYKKKKGHRQPFSEIEILKISA